MRTIGKTCETQKRAMMEIVKLPVLKQKKLETYHGLFQSMLGGSSFMTANNDASLEQSDVEASYAHDMHILIEKQQFLAAQSICPHVADGIINFYTEQEHLLPIHTLAFRSKCCACGTEAGIERMLSKPGPNNTAHRNRLTPKVLSATIKINSNHALHPVCKVIHTKYTAMK